MTRIQSVFNQLKRVGFALLLLGGSAIAQPLEVLWEREGHDDSSRFGSRVFALGDQNDDGFADWGVSSGGQPWLSRVELFYGGNPPAQEPYRVFEPILDSIPWFLGGYSLGDLNGDGYTDFGLTFSTDYDSEENGRDAIYFGGGDPQREPDIILNRSHHSSGRNLAGIGDFNGDGFDDLLDRSPAFSTTQYVYFGSVTFDTMYDWSVTNNPGTQSEYPLSWGDTDGDGFVDLTNFMPPGEGVLKVFWGGVSPDTIAEEFGPYPDQMWDLDVLVDLNGDGASELFGTRAFNDLIVVIRGRRHIPLFSDYELNTPAGGVFDRMVGIGDFNNDGFGDCIGITNANNGAWWGVFSIYLGYFWLNRDPVITVYGRAQPYNLIGPRSAAGLGDVNGDGVDDFIVGTWHDDVDGMRGKAIVFAGDQDYHVSFGGGAPLIPEELEIRVSPNPFNVHARIDLSLPFHVTTLDITIYNVLGQVLESATLRPFGGRVTHYFNGQALPSGLYLIMAQAGNLVETSKLLLLK